MGQGTAHAVQAGMFNNESTHTERQQVLQSLMGKGAGSMGSDVHTPREINELLARSEEEFKTFQQVYTDCNQGSSNVWQDHLWRSTFGC